MIQIEEKEIVKGIDEAYKKAGQNAYFGNGFQAGVYFALEQVKNLTMSTVKNKEMNILDNLKEYLDNTPREQVLKDWEETKEANKDVKSPTIKEFLKILNK